MTAVRRELCGFGGLGVPGTGNSRGQGLKQESVRRQWLKQACEGRRGLEVRERGGPVCLVRIENRRKRKIFPFKGWARLLWRGHWQGREGTGWLSRGSGSEILLQD